jgi:hypothetical protein
MKANRAFVYVDGFNLYRRSLQGRKGVKWLNLQALATRCLPEYDVVRIYYFSARIKPSASLDASAPQRQQAYLRALATQHPQVKVYLGHFRAAHRHMVTIPKTLNPEATGWQTTKVLKTEEKGSDVNLAARMVADLLSDACDIAVILTNDSDHAGQIEMLTYEFGKRVGLLLPFQDGVKGNRLLRQQALELKRTIQIEDLRACQLPRQLYDRYGQIHCPEAWLSTEGLD